MARQTGHSDVDQVRLATDLVALVGEHVALKSRGREHVGLCPFHDDHKPSLAVVTHKGNAFYKCHSCGAAGDCFDFVMTYHKLDFAEALRHLANRAGIELRSRYERSSGPRDDSTSAAALRRANALAAEYFSAALRHPSAGTGARRILEERGISAEMIGSFGLGFAPESWDGLIKLAGKQGISAATLCAAGLAKTRAGSDGCYDAFRNRITFTISDPLGHPIAFGARQIRPEDEPKYLNSAESTIFRKSATLYGLNLAKRAIVDVGTVVITEGYTDVIACHQAGIRNVVATLGTALTREHAAILKRLGERVVVLFDGDEAGLRAADRALEMFFDQSLDLRIAVLPDGRDPDDLLRQPNGVEAMQQVIDEAADALSYKVGRFQAFLRGAETPTARANRLEAFLDELCELGMGKLQGPRRRLVCVQLADALSLPLPELESALAAAAVRRPRRPASEAASSMPATNAGQQTHLGDRTDAAAEYQAAPKGRYLAERELLAALLAEPTLMNQAVPGKEGTTQRLSQASGADLFAHDLHLATFKALQVAISDSAADDPSVHSILGSLEDPGARQQATTIYLDGARWLEDQPDAVVERLQTAHAALCRLIRTEQFLRDAADVRRQPVMDDPVLVGIVESRRRIGSRPSAIPTGVRS